MTMPVKRWVGAAALILSAAAALVGGRAGVDHARTQWALKNENLTGLRVEALDLFPRGSHLEEAEAHMAHIGFSCEPIAHPMPDISSPSLRCASNGRGYPDYPAVNVVLLSRNGLVTDVDVWNIMARADMEVDDIDFTATGASDALSPQLRRPERPQAADMSKPDGDEAGS